VIERNTEKKKMDLSPSNAVTVGPSGRKKREGECRKIPEAVEEGRECGTLLHKTKRKRKNCGAQLQGSPKTKVCKLVEHSGSTACLALCWVQKQTAKAENGISWD